MKVTHKVEREEWSEHPDESERIVCDWSDDKYGYEDPKCSLNWEAVTCKRCLRKAGKK